MRIEREFAFIVGIPIFIIIEFVRYIKFKSSKSTFIPFKEMLIMIFSVYLMTLVSVTLLPFSTFMLTKPTINIIPIYNTIKDISMVDFSVADYMAKFWIVNILGNLILLIPLAIILPMIFKKLRDNNITILICFLISILIEFMQYLSMFLGNVRAVDIDDVILNTLGGVIGFLIFKLLNISNGVKGKEYER